MLIVNDANGKGEVIREVLNLKDTGQVYV